MSDDWKCWGDGEFLGECKIELPPSDFYDFVQALQTEIAKNIGIPLEIWKAMNAPPVYLCAIAYRFSKN